MVDTTPPSLTINSPTSGSYNNTGGVTVNWTTSDSGSGLAMTEVKVDTGSWSVVTGMNDTLTSLADGPHTVTVKVTDNIGNVNNASVTFIVDTTSRMSLCPPQGVARTSIHHR